ncbi:hypothetical protein [Polaribacter filamentus]|uniref:hypothetical protein n=1 Tax=Polaribacter filamentus TaxID=53483 RepID=UPI001F0BDCD2|nr:hypothetical protein [Polaribacter filamentus]
MLSIAAIGYTQEKQPTFKAEGDLVKATYYYEDGSVKTEGYFKDKKLLANGFVLIKMELKQK